MKLESLALWAEKDLLTEEGNENIGFLSAVRLWFENGTLMGSGTEMPSEFDEVLCFLQGEDGHRLMASESSMKNLCAERLHDHVPYAFGRECFGFRILTKDHAWYIAVTPWNEKKHFTVFLYLREILMKYLAELRGLPENCYGVNPYTEERIRVRFGADTFESFPQYGANKEENAAFANEQNGIAGITNAQVSAMVNGIIYGWETPMADVKNYDENGYFEVVGKEERKGKR